MDISAHPTEAKKVSSLSLAAILVYVVIALQIISLAFGYAVFAEDLPDWVGQGYLLHDIISHGAGSLKYKIIFMPIPNSITQLISFIFSYFFSPQTTSKIISIVFLCSALYVVDINIRVKKSLESVRDHFVF